MLTSLEETDRPCSARHLSVMSTLLYPGKEFTISHQEVRMRSLHWILIPSPLVDVR